MFIESIIKVYKSREEESNMLGTLILILIVLVIFFYFYFKVTQTQILLDWQNQRCNPKYIFFSYYLNPVEGQDPYTSIKNNFMQCIKPFTTIIKTKDYRDFKNTTDNITKTTDSLSRYVETIDTDTKRKVTGWEKHYNDINKSANNIDNVSDDKYSEQKDAYNQVRIYAQRIHDILYSITSYIKNKLLFRVSENKGNFKIMPNNNIDYNIPESKNNINDIKNYLYDTYLAISDNEYKQSFELLQRKKAQPNFNPELTDFSISINKADEAIKKYRYLIEFIDEFDRQNGPLDSPEASLLYDTIDSCNKLYEYNYDCKEIFPNWETSFKKL
jgi:hypothetical protein